MAPACMCSPVPQPPSSRGKSGGKERGMGLGGEPERNPGREKEAQRQIDGNRNRQGCGERALAKVVLLALGRHEVH